MADVATVDDPARFKTGPDLAACVGLTRRTNSTGGKDKGGSISKQGDRYLRQLFVQGAAAVVRAAHNPRATSPTPWPRCLLARKKPKVAIVTQANNMVRTAWAVLMSSREYRADSHAMAA